MTQGHQYSCERREHLLYQLYGSDPENYGEIVFEPIIPWNCEKIEYRIKSVNTFANFMITTSDDYVWIVKPSDTKYCLVSFSDQNYYDSDALPETLSTLFKSIGIAVSFNNTGTMVFTSSSAFTIDSASHRVKLLLGLFDSTFPLESQQSGEKYTITAPACPMTSFGNVLYLQSLQGSAVGSRVDRNYYTAPVIYRINAFIRPGLPLIMNKKQDKVIVNTDAAKSIKITLTDFKFERIILKSPLFVCIKIKPHY